MYTYKYVYMHINMYAYIQIHTCVTRDICSYKTDVYAVKRGLYLVRGDLCSAWIYVCIHINTHICRTWLNIGLFWLNIDLFCINVGIFRLNTRNVCIHVNTQCVTHKTLFPRVSYVTLMNESWKRSKNSVFVNACESYNIFEYACIHTNAHMCHTWNCVRHVTFMNESLKRMKPFFSPICVNNTVYMNDSRIWMSHLFSCIHMIYGSYKYIWIYIYIHSFISVSHTMCMNDSYIWTMYMNDSGICLTHVYQWECV